MRQEVSTMGFLGKLLLPLHKFPFFFFLMLLVVCHGHPSDEGINSWPKWYENYFKVKTSEQSGAKKNPQTFKLKQSTLKIQLPMTPLPHTHTHTTFQGSLLIRNTMILGSVNSAAHQHQKVQENLPYLLKEALTPPHPPPTPGTMTVFVMFI